MSHRTQEKSVRDMLLHDHERLAKLARRVATCVDANDVHEALVAWKPLEDGVLAHFDSEEMYILPALEPTDPGEVGELRAEHDKLRATLGELGMALELHTARKSAFDDFAARIQKHADREEALMYRWAEEHAPRPIVETIGRRLSAAWERATHARA